MAQDIQHINVQDTVQKFSPAQKQKLQKASRDFEAIFISMMLKSMRGEEKSSEFGESFGGEMVKGMFDGELAKHISKSSSFGVAEAMYKKITGESLQELKQAQAGMKLHTEVPRTPRVVTKKQIEILEGKISFPEKQQTKPSVIRTGEASVPKQVKEIIVPVVPLVKDSVNIHSNTMERVTSYDHIIEQAADTTGINKNLIKAMIVQESGGKNTARSSKNAKGLMQLIDTTAASVGVKNVWDPHQNINGGAKYLKQQLDRFEGNIPLALASYNAGPGNIEKYNGIPPFKETQNYVKRVMNLFAALQSSENEKQ